MYKSKEDIYYAVVPHMLKQAKHCVDASPVGTRHTLVNNVLEYPRYRLPNTKVCDPVGFFIDARDYRPILETVPMSVAYEMSVGFGHVPPEHQRAAVLSKILLAALSKTIGMTKENLSLLMALQSAHDNYPVSNWRGAFEAIRQKFDIAPRAQDVNPNLALQNVV